MLLRSLTDWFLMAMRVLIADDHELVRGGLRVFVNKTFDDATIFEADTLAKAIDFVRKEPVNLALLGFWFPDGSALGVLAEFKSQSTYCPVLMVSLHLDAEFALMSIRAGAAGYIATDASYSEFSAAMKLVVNGGQYIQPSVLNAKDASSNATDQPPHRSLRRREFEILGMTCKGLTVKEIASALNICPKTVNNVRRRLRTKLGLETTGALIKYGVERGISA